MLSSCLGCFDPSTIPDSISSFVQAQTVYLSLRRYNPTVGSRPHWPVRFACVAIHAEVPVLLSLQDKEEASKAAAAAADNNNAAGAAEGEEQEGSEAGSWETASTDAEVRGYTCHTCLGHVLVHAACNIGTPAHSAVKHTQFTLCRVL